MKIGVYCGSFNPVHNGHLTIIDEVMKSGLVERLLVIITGNYWYKQNLPPMLRRKELFPPFKDDRVSFDTTHCGMSYTYQILQALEQENPNDDLVLIIGSDNLPYMPQWNHAAYTMNHEFIVVARDESATTYATRLPFKSYHVLYIDNIDHISSTYIRQHIHDFKAVKDMIPVQSYEKMCRLYEGYTNV